MKFDFTAINIHNGTKREMRIWFLDGNLRIFIDDKEIDNEAMFGWPEDDIRDLVFGKHRNYDIADIPKEKHEKLKQLLVARRL
jgi:hypothetical protein